MRRTVLGGNVSAYRTRLARVLRGFTFANVQRANTSSTVTDDAQLYGTGGWFRFVPSARLFWGVQYQKSWASAAGVAASDLYVDPNAETRVRLEGISGGFDGVSLLLGTDYVTGPHKVIGGVQFFDGELADNKDADYRLTVLAAAYEYKFAKTVGLRRRDHLVRFGRPREAQHRRRGLRKRRYRTDDRPQLELLIKRPTSVPKRRRARTRAPSII